ncbi:uncharacterized protein [Dermacentor albipictus]|uniref:uncharacterized protein n=1 Tax=Dermacentor albipictus TaxID=60249 RepID=UPI0031FE0F02
MAEKHIRCDCRGHCRSGHSKIADLNSIPCTGEESLVQCTYTTGKGNEPDSFSYQVVATSACQAIHATRSDFDNYACFWCECGVFQIHECIKAREREGNLTFCCK